MSLFTIASQTVFKIPPTSVWLKLILLLVPIIPSTLFGQEASENITKVERGQRCSLKNTPQNINSKIDEGSGLAAWNGRLWTHNDSGRQTLFALDSVSYNILEEYNLPVRNIDWEEITQDNNFFYLGNFGNNLGQRKRLAIYRINKEKLMQRQIVLDSISFEWPKTSDSGSTKQINFDCEAMIVVNDTIMLFTKEYKKRRCSRIFRIPATPNHHIAEYVTTLKTRTLVTGATFFPETRRVVLSGYSMLLSARIVTFTLSPANVISGAKQLRVRGYFRQNEGIATSNGTDFYLISEATDLILWKNKPRISKVRIEQ